MPTFEERLDGLERALTTNVQHLQQQITEQKRERDMAIAHLGLIMNQRFDTLEKALTHQFGLINTRFEAHEAWFRRMEQRFDHFTIEIKQKFDESDHFAARTYGMTVGQERDIKIMKADISDIKGRLTVLENKVDEGFIKIDKRFSKVEVHLDKMDERLDKMEKRFDRMDERFDQVISLLQNKDK